MECGVLNTEKCRSSLSETIRNMIVRRNRERMDKLAPAIAKRDTKLRRLMEEEDMLSGEQKKLKRKIDAKRKQVSKRLNELKISTESRSVYVKGKYKGNRRFFVSNPGICHISEADTRLLQKADNLFVLKRRKEAREIWNMLIEKHKLIGD